MNLNTSIAFRAETRLLNADSMTVLAVEDDPIAMTFLDSQIAALGHRALHAHNGKEAIEILRQSNHIIDMVLMDREMPVMDGLTAIQLIKEDSTLKHIPIVMVTGADSAEEMEEGLKSGVFYYLTKPVKEGMLCSVMEAAMQEARQAQRLHEELSRHRASFELIESCRLTFQTLEQAESLAAFMARCFPEPERALTGLGDLLVNAIEHGNLGIGYVKKGELVANQTWREEVTKRQALPEHCEKIAIATIARKPTGIYAIIEDAGHGFNWQRYLHIDPTRSGDNHGRGIAQANATSFDRLTYNETGNKAIAFMAHQKKLEW